MDNIELTLSAAHEQQEDKLFKLNLLKYNIYVYSILQIKGTS